MKYETTQQRIYKTDVRQIQRWAKEEDFKFAQMIHKMVEERQAREKDIFYDLYKKTPAVK